MSYQQQCAFKAECTLATVKTSDVRIVFFFHFESNRIAELLLEISNRIE